MLHERSQGLGSNKTLVQKHNGSHLLSTSSVWFRWRSFLRARQLISVFRQVKQAIQKKVPIKRKVRYGKQRPSCPPELGSFCCIPVSYSLDFFSADGFLPLMSAERSPWWPYLRHGWRTQSLTRKLFWDKILWRKCRHHLVERWEKIVNERNTIYNLLSSNRRRDVSYSVKMGREYFQPGLYTSLEWIFERVTKA